MTRRGILAVAMASVVSLVGSSCALDRGSYRFRVTVEVDTPQGLRTGSSVMQIKAFRGIKIGDSSDTGALLTGEAVAIDLPNGTLFMLLGNPKGDGSLLGHVTTEFIPDGQSDKFLAAVKTLGRSDSVGRTATLNPSHYPLFVRFTNIDDPRSVEEVDPKNIATAFGSRIFVRRIILSITKDDITQSIKSKLRWLTDHDTGLDNGGPPTTHPTLAQLVRFSFFVESRK